MQTSSFKNIGIKLLVIGLFLSLSIYAEKKTTYPFVDNVKQRWQPTGQTAWMLTGFTDFETKITAMDMSPDGQFLAIGNDNGEVIFFDLFEQKTLWKSKVLKKREAIFMVRMSHDGSQVLAAKTPGQNDFSNLYMIAADGGVTDMGVQEAFNPECSFTKMDPVDAAWSADTKTFYILYETHARANRGSCMVALEFYVWANNMVTGVTAVKNVIIDAFAKPEEDEPDTVWCFKLVRLAAYGNDTFATSTCNSRIIKWVFKNNQITAKYKSNSILFNLRKQGYAPIGGTGYMTFNDKGGIYFGMGEPGAMSKSDIVYVSSNLTKFQLLAQIHSPYPYPQISKNESTLLAGTDTNFLWNQKKNEILFWGPIGKSMGQLSKIHPTKKLVILVSGSSIYYLIERKAKTVTLSTDWLKTELYLQKKDSAVVVGKGKIGFGTGNWLREEWKQDGYWINNGIGGGLTEDVTEEGELSLRLQEGSASFTIYGGRSSSEDTIINLLGNLPSW